MTFEWDEYKRRANLDRHGIDFEDAIAIWVGPVFESPSDQRQHGEDRVVATGIAEGRLITVIYTWRTDKRRMISARKASKRERKNYDKMAGR